MAQYAQDGGQHADPFSYMPEYSGDHPFMPFADDGMNAPGILNQDDTIYMSRFFQNPNQPPMGDEPNWFGDQANFTLDGTGLEQEPQLPDFNQGSQSLQGPPVALGSQTGQGPRHLTHSQHQNHPQPQHQNQQHVPTTPHLSEYGEHSGEANFDEDSAVTAAAHNLQQMQRRVSEQVHLFSQFSAHQAYHVQANGYLGGNNWSGIAGGHQIGGGQGQGQGQQDQVNLHSPLTSSGRQSANSYHSQQQHLQQSAYPLHPGYQTDPRWLTSASQPTFPTHQQTRHQSFHGFHVPDPQAAQGGQIAQPHLQHLQRSPYGGFGSDLNFGSAHYQPPNDHMAQVDAKGANLNDVPFASQLSVHSPLPHGHPPNPEQLARLYHPQNSHNFQAGAQHFTLQSPQSQLGGLPNPSPTSYRPNYVAGAMANHNTASQDSSEEEAEHQPRKRRKSGRDEADDDYAPSGGARNTRSRRSSRVVAGASNSNDEEIEVRHVVAATNRGRAPKRRMTSTSGRSSPGSQEYTSPRGQQSETPDVETKSSSRKKKGNGPPRNNLTEEEKRQNHIRSEKFRRDLIKSQYDELDILVPGLKSGKSGLSRADILLEIVNYVEMVAKGNEKAVKVIESWTADSAGPTGGNG